MMPNRLVLWDIDGTLLSAGGFGWRLIDRAFQGLYGLPLVHTVPLAGRTDRAILHDVLTTHGVAGDVEELLAAIEALAPHADDFHTGGGRILAGAAEAIRALGGRPEVVQSVLTGNLGAVAATKLSAVGLGEGLDLTMAAYGRDHAVRAELVGVARAGFARRYPAAESSPVTVLIGDTPLDVEAAHTTGARAVGVATGSYSVAELAAAGADVVLADLTDTAGVVEAVLS